MMYKYEKQTYENLTKRIFEGVGKYNIPVIQPENTECQDFIGFNYAQSCNDREEAEWIGQAIERAEENRTVERRWYY